jgi:hypothetical protein
MAAGDDGAKNGCNTEGCPRDVGSGAPPATIRVAWRALRHEIHVTRTFHTSAVWQA